MNGESENIERDGEEFAPRFASDESLAAIAKAPVAAVALKPVAKISAEQAKRDAFAERIEAASNRIVNMDQCATAFAYFTGAAKSLVSFHLCKVNREKLTSTFERACEYAVTGK